MNPQVLVIENSVSDIRAGRVKFMQWLGWIFLRPVIKFFTRCKVQAMTDLRELKSPVIIASNHVSYLDPPLIGSVFPKNSDIFPLYFIAADYLCKIPVFGRFIKSCGAFPACKKQGYEKSLAKPKQILASGRSVVIFPQAHPCLEFKTEEGRVGTAMLALESGARILPVAICGLTPFSWRNLFLRKYKTKIVIGQPFRLAEIMVACNLDSVDLNAATRVIMEEIRRLLVA